MPLLHNFWIVQGIGAIGLIFILLAWNSKERQKILSFHAVSFAIMIVHYILLAAYIGAISCSITLLRNVIYLGKGKRQWASHPLWFWFFVLLSSVALAFFWKGWITVMPVAGIIFGTYSVGRTNPKEMRIYMLIAAILWIPYNVYVHSYSGLVSQIVTSVAILMGMYRHDRKRLTVLPD